MGNCKQNTCTETPHANESYFSIHVILGYKKPQDFLITNVCPLGHREKYIGVSIMNMHY